MQTRTDNAAGPATIALAIATLMLSACQTSMTDATPGPAGSAAAQGRPTLAEGTITPENSRPLGLFDTEAEAVAAARAADLAPGVYGLASAGGVPLAITADGTIYLRAQFAGPILPSGVAQRPPQD